MAVYKKVLAYITKGAFNRGSAIFDKGRLAGFTDETKTGQENRYKQRLYIWG